MLQFKGAVRTAITWFTLFLFWSAFILWRYGMQLHHYIASHSNLFAYELAVRTLQSDMMPQGMSPFLTALLTLTAGAVLSVLTLLGWNLILFACCRCLPVMAGEWLLRRTGLIRAEAKASVER
ncbi:hypothetical protein CG435_22165 [Pantoea ananatis]|uniref:hypothetical protein n=1 Tax=Pantoea ananas TaxID=553 RepID=UPI000CF4B984|nr:hypothetical protein [Pantoea ananatis]PQK95188.1 hypothetical protein CG435_22165 [Pantoea ananatis]